MADIENMLCSRPLTDPILAGKIRIGRSVKMSGFFITGGAVGFIVKDKKCQPKCRSFRAAVKKSPALNVLKN